MRQARAGQVRPRPVKKPHDLYAELCCCCCVPGGGCFRLYTRVRGQRQGGRIPVAALQESPKVGPTFSPRSIPVPEQ
jgi:hypothetical protein